MENWKGVERKCLSVSVKVWYGQGGASLKFILFTISVSQDTLSYHNNREKRLNLMGDETDSHSMLDLL